MLIDDFMPTYNFNEVHSIVIQAEPEAVFRAIKEVTPAEIALLRTLFRIRSLPEHFAGKGGMTFEDGQPLLEQMLNGGFVQLAKPTDQELVLGHIGQFWKLRDGSSSQIANAQEFLAFDDPGYAKAALNFYVDESPGSGGATVRTETRIHIPDRTVRKKFAAYWRIIYPGSALIRKMWLKAIKRRAEQG